MPAEWPKSPTRPEAMAGASETAEVAQSAAHGGRVAALEGKVDAIRPDANRPDAGGKGAALGKNGCD